MVLVTGAMASVISKLGKLLNDEYKLQTGVRKKIQTLTRDLESMHAALRKTADVPPNQLDDEVKLWARDVRELSYNVEDILDTFLVRVDSRDEDPKPNKLKRAAMKIGKLLSKSKAHHKIANMINTINEQAEEVAERHRRYRADDIVAKPATTSTVDPRLAAMFREVSQLVGIDKSSADLISMLSPKGEDDSSQKMKIVSVVGVGGLGKTTLAKAVYDKLKSLFGRGAFVPVGQDPDLKKVFRDILIDLDKEKYTDMRFTTLDERQLINELHVILQTKRYFVVIDDIWEAQSWETIKLALAENNCGSRIVITSRKSEVAKEANEVYRLEPLSHDDSKKLFHMRLFGGEDERPSNHSDELSDRILKKCGGVPLAIITMASLLLGKSRKEWIDVCDSPGFYQDKDDRHMENTMHILSLSYYDLPSHLKTCLLYLSVFPEDSHIDKDSLIWKWVAEGFVEKKPGHGLFEVGEEYFHDLINRSMIEGVNFGVYGIINGCRVHDMVLDLIISKSNEENFVSADGTLSESNARRLALKNRKLDLTQDTHVNLPQVRSFIVWRCAIVKWALHPRLKLIRVLNLEGCTFGEGCLNLEHIGDLLHLRHLGIQGSRCKELPETIGALKFLQTLNLGHTEIPELPCSIAKLTELVCLRAWWTGAPVGAIWKLTSLEELQITVHMGNVESWGQFVKDIGNLCELRVLNISFTLRMVSGLQTDLIQSLGNLKKLQHLTLHGFIAMVNMNVWDAAVPSRELRSLFLPHIDFPKLPSWINSAHLPSLTHLVIRVSGMDEQALKALGRLPELCHLNLKTSSMETITGTNIVSDGSFQKLRSLMLARSMIDFIANELANEDPSPSFAICQMHKGMATGRSRKKDDCRVAPAVVVMPNLEELWFTVIVREVMQNKVVSSGDLGLEYLPSIRKVNVDLWCFYAFEDDVEREEAALRHAIQVHPNSPALEIEYSGKENMMRRSECHVSTAEEDGDSNYSGSDDDDPAQPRNDEAEETPVPATAS